MAGRETPTRGGWGRGGEMMLEWDDGEVQVEKAEGWEDVKKDARWRGMELRSFPRIVSGNGRGTRERKRCSFVVVTMRWRRVPAPALLIAGFI